MKEVDTMRDIYEKEDLPPIRPALTPEAREQQLISLAQEEAEKQLRNGTASSQIIVHYLKLGSTREKIEQEIMAKQKEMIEAKTESLKSAMSSDEFYQDALEAMKRYSGTKDDD